MVSFAVLWTRSHRSGFISPCPDDWENVFLLRHTGTPYNLTIGWFHSMAYSTLHFVTHDHSNNFHHSMDLHFTTRDHCVSWWGHFWYHHTLGWCPNMITPLHHMLSMYLIMMSQYSCRPFATPDHKDNVKMMYCNSDITVLWCHNAASTHCKVWKPCNFCTFAWLE